MAFSLNCSPAVRLNMTKMTRYLPGLILAAGVAFSAPACATRIYETGYPRANYPPPPQVRADYISVAARNGYRDGVDAGRDDARHRERFDPVRAMRYRDGDHDYDRRYGPRDEYGRDYRSAFERGYDDGYRRAR
jgi:hypothetical protein